MRKKVIPQGVKGSKLYKYIPFDTKNEIAGYLKKGILYYEKGGQRESGVFPEDNCDFEFHTHPFNNIVMPSVADLTKHLLSFSDVNIIVAAKELAVITRTKKTERISRELFTKNMDLLCAVAAGQVVDEKSGQIVSRKTAADERNTLKALSKWLDDLCKKRLIKRPVRMVLEWSVDWEYIYRHLLRFRIKHYKRYGKDTKLMKHYGS